MAVKTFTQGEKLTTADTNTYLANSGLVYVTSTTFGSPQAAVNLDNIFTSTYAIYSITFQFVNSSDGQNMYLQFREGGTTYTTANYFSSQIFSTYLGGGPSALGQNAATFFNIGGAGNYMNHNVLTVVNPQKATRATLSWQNFMNGASYAQQYVGGGAIAATNQFDGIRVVSSSGTITGTIRVYGQRQV